MQLQAHSLQYAPESTLRHIGYACAISERRDSLSGDGTEMLESIGVTEDERNLRNKVSRGKVTAVFLLRCLKVLGTEDWFCCKHFIRLKASNIWTQLG